MSSEKYEQFEKVFENKGVECKACIITHPSPDPDAIGCAVGVKHILKERFEIDSDIFHDGEVSHPQNQTEVNVLDIRLKKKRDFDESEYSFFICVDTTPENTNFDIDSDWDVIFDHHHVEGDAKFTDIRSTGSCASIVWDYMHGLDIDLDGEDGTIVSTALFFGVVNDTDGLLSDNVSDLDFRAHSNLIKKINRKKYQDIKNYPLPPYLFDLRALASENTVCEASILISYLGILSSKRRDALPIISDEFLRMEGVETVVVFCMIDGNIHASVRSRNSSVNVHQFCQKVFGPECGGGKQGSGGARIPIGFLYSPDDDDELKNKLSEFIQDTLSDRIIKHLSGA